MDDVTLNELRQALKVVLRQYKVMNTGVRRQLEALGFRVEKGKRHYRLYYKNDTKHYCCLSASSSDWRAGDNAVSIICNQLLQRTDL